MMQQFFLSIDADRRIFRVVRAIARDSRVPKLIEHFHLKFGALNREIGGDISHADGLAKMN